MLVFVKQKKAESSFFSATQKKKTQQKRSLGRYPYL